MFYKRIYSLIKNINEGMKKFIQLIKGCIWAISVSCSPHSFIHDLVGRFSKLNHSGEMEILWDSILGSFLNFSTCGGLDSSSKILNFA